MRNISKLSAEIRRDPQRFVPVVIQMGLNDQMDIDRVASEEQRSRHRKDAKKCAELSKP
jgi:hypothetical protein